MAASTLPGSVVSTAWLSEHLGQPSLKVVDASTYLPNAGRNAKEEYLKAHVPGALFADIGWLSDASAPYPHTLLSADVFGERIGSLGISNNDAVIVYDGSGQNFSAPRLWWMLQIFGHHNVAVLDGGIRKWIADGYPVDCNTSDITPATFVAKLDSSRVRDMSEVRANIDSKNEQTVDARSQGRFAATEPEPRPGVRGGHIPGSANIHYASLVNDDGTLRSHAEIRAIVSDAGLNTERPIMASCGTGLTACAVVLALDAIGVHNVSVYDGSWTEWGSTPDAPVATGPARG
ncbi:MAG: 3-mercaptopyruvate sulfurtransferase [Gemmatimonadota bacterium]|nr:3-mercaptopyruvate sulfurtransferase [Gemmatimonadota bacterium]